MSAGIVSLLCEQGADFNLVLRWTSYRRPAPPTAAYVDAAMTASSGVLTSATAQFVPGDVGRTVIVAGAGAAGVDLVSTIASYQSASQVTLTTPASTTVASANLEIYVPNNLTGYTAKLQVRQSRKSTAALVLTSTPTLGGAAGTITISIAASVTDALAPGTYAYDLELTSGGGIITRLIQGDFVVSPEVTV